MAVKIVIPELEDRDFMYREYIEKNRSVQDLATQFGVSKDTIIRKIRKYGIKKDKKLSHKLAEKTYLKHYGVKNPQQLEEFKNKSKQTNLERYGVEYITQSKEFKERIKQTNLEKYGATTYAGSKEGKEKIMKTVQERYGVDNPGKIPGIREKIKQTMLEKYGTDSPFGLPDFEEKRKKTNLEKYGVEYSLQNKEIQAKSKKTLMERYGVDHYSKAEEYKQAIREQRAESLKVNGIDISKIDLTSMDTIIKSLSKYYAEQNKILTTKIISHLLNRDYCYIDNHINTHNLKDLVRYHPLNSECENEIFEFIKSLGFDNILRNKQDIIPPQELDIYLPDKNIGFEFNGSFRHSEDKRPQKYHQNKSINGIDHNVFIYNIFEYEREHEESRNKIKKQIEVLLKPKALSEYKIKEISDAETEEFVNKYSFEKYALSKTNIGMYVNNELVGIISFDKRKSFRTNTAKIMNIATNYSSECYRKIIEYYMEKYGTKLYISLNITRHNLLDFLKFGFKFVNYTDPNYVRFKHNGNKIDYFDVKNSEKKKKLHDEGRNRIFDCGSAILEKV